MPSLNFSSSGGFSNYHKIPSYQQETVARYFDKNPSPYPTYHFNGSRSSVGANGGRFNRFGKAYPDVSALGASYLTVFDGCPTNLGGGTSAAAPLFATIVWKINTERISAGKSTLGFINPALYANPHVLKDIVSGSNPGCGTNGFSAVEG